MQTTSAQPTLKRVVLVGGGHAHALFLRMAAMQPLPQTELVLVSQSSQTAYSGMLPGCVEGRYREDELFIDLRRLCQASGAVFIRARATGLDLAARRLMLVGRPPLAFDLLSFNIGSTPIPLATTGVDAWVAVKPIEPFLAHWQRLVARTETGSAEAIVIAGGGAGGVELALAMHTRLKGKAPISLVQSAPTLLPKQAASAGRHLARELKARGIELLLNTRLVAIDAGSQLARTADGRVLRFTALYGATPATAPQWFQTTGLRLDAQGFLAVGPTLECLGQSGIYAVGDCAAVAGKALPKAGVFAVRQGAPLFANIRRALAGDSPVATQQKSTYLALIGLADGSALATRRQWALAGPWVLRWKEHIDRRFMRRFTSLPVPPAMPTMAAPVSSGPQAQMRCHGCGAKVGGAVLSGALSRIEAEFPDVVRGPALTWGLTEREDTSWLAPTPGRQLLQSIDYFPSLVEDPFLAGRLACIHAFSDILAKGATPHSAHVLAVMGLAAPQLTAERLYQTLAGVATELRRYRAQLAGGHTAEGEAAALGLMVNGTISTQPLRKDAGRAGDVLLLTKAIGTGLIFAAQMQGRAKAAWLDAALHSMQHSHWDLLPLLDHPGIHAATDVTGFGLAGHLGEMLRTRTLHAYLDSGAIPCLPGAQELALAGVASSLYPDNRLALNDVVWGKDPGLLTVLWADPQTCGGFLLCVAPGIAAELIANVHRLGYHDAAIIGHLTARDSSEALITWS